MVESLALIVESLALMVESLALIVSFACASLDSAVSLQHHESKYARQQEEHT
jgi:hypothetical protein